MLNCLLLSSLGLVAPTASGGEGILIYYAEDEHRIERILEEGASNAQSTRERRHNVPVLRVNRGAARTDGMAIVKIERRNGTQVVTEMRDPRLLRAPLREDGTGHEAIVVKSRGAYVIRVADSASITAMEIELPRINVGPDRRLSQ